MKFKKKVQDISELRVRRRRGRALFAAITGFLGFAALIIALLLLVLRTPTFRVREIEITGNARVQEEYIRGFLKAKIPGSWLGHIFGSRTILVWPRGFDQEELVLLPDVERIDISKNYFRRKVTVTVTEAEREGVWCWDAAVPPKCYWFDGAGRMLTRVSSMSGNLVAVVRDLDRTAIPKGEPVLPPRLLPHMLSILASLGKADVNIREIVLEDLGREELRVRTVDGPDLLFSLRFPAPDLSIALKAVRSETAFSNLQYVDFRVERRAYYK